MRRPSFQFYPADWQKDAALQSCSMAAQGLWINLMCIAHECEPYGYLVINNKPMKAEQIARLVGLSAKNCEKILKELLEASVVKIDENGAMFSQRMVNDELTRILRAAGGQAGAEHGYKGAEHGIKGGRPPKARGDNEPPLEPPPSSSSSSSTSVNKEAKASVICKQTTDDRSAQICSAIIDLYHELMPNNPRCKVINTARRKTIVARWKEAAKMDCQPFGYDNKDDGLIAWRQFFSVCAESEFLTGRTQPLPGRPPFIADIDFLLSPNGFIKCLENKYHRG